MPNHVTSVITINSPSASEVLSYIAGEKHLFDFNKIMPIPESLNIESGTRSEYGEWIAGGNPPDFCSISIEEAKKRLGDRLEEYTAIGRARIDNRKKYGSSDWYGWAIEKWGTKWNSYDNEMRGENIVKIETAWSIPEPIFTALSAKFSDAEFLIDYADEDTGSNCGKLIFKSGVKAIITDNKNVVPDGFKNWNHFALKLCYPNDDAKSHCYNEDWEYDESLE